MPSRLASPPRLVVITVVVLLATALIFALDSVLPAGHDAAHAYVLTVLVTGLTRRRALVISAGVVFVALTLVAAVLKPVEGTGHSHESIVFGRSLAVVLILVTVVLVVAAISRESEATALGRALKDAEHGRESDRRMLAAASAVAAIGTWSVDREDNLVTWSDTAAAIHGRPPGHRPSAEELLGYLRPQDLERFTAALDDAWEDGTPFREEFLITLPNRTERWLVAMGEPLRGQDNSVHRIHGTVQDVTPWRLAELAAQTQHNRFAQLTSSLPIIVWTATPDGAIDFFNDALLKYTGLSESELLADQWLAIVHPDDVEVTVERWSVAVETGQPYDLEFRIQGHDGIYRWHHVAAQPERDDSGQIVRWWGSATNIDVIRTLNERADLLARERETILESMNDGLYALDQDFCILYANGSAETILGHPRSELIGRVIWDVFPGSQETPAARIIMRAMDEGSPDQLTYFSEILDKWLDLSVTKSAVGVTVFLRDVTDVKAMSEQLYQSQRLEAVGQLTGGIAHDFNNLLTVVLGGAEALVADEALSPDGREMATIIGQAAQRGAELTHRLLAFARRQPLEPRTVDLAQRLRDLAPLLRRTIGEDISMAVTSPRDDALALVDPTQYDNAVLNLAINARDAMPGGGSLTIEVDTITLDDTYATGHAEVTPGTYAVTTVTDSGVGISPDVVGKLFDPFFTTKSVGKGSGLGLAMVWGFVKQSNGHVTVYSEPNYGTSFRLYLPAASALADASEDTVSTPTAPHVAHGRILLAEDDDLVRTFAASQLRSHGYEVVEAGSGPEALEALESMGDLDLLFTDVIMPGGMTGKELADAVVQRRPDTPVVYASGYTENVILHNGRLDAGVRLLAKPYSARQLLDCVGQAISTQRTEAP